MKLTDYLNAFSVDDLRQLAERREIRLTDEALKSRQTLVRNLASVIGSWESAYNVVSRLNTGELALLRLLVQNQKNARLTALAQAVDGDQAVVKRHLESLRLYGLIFPEGDWEHMAVPPTTLMLAHYLTPTAKSEKVVLEPPALEPAPDVACSPRPGSLATDLAEFLARVARARFKLTQAGRINRRDLKAMESAFAISTSGYSSFLSTLAIALGMLSHSKSNILEVLPFADAWLALDPLQRSGEAATTWLEMRGYPENVPGDPAEADYVPLMLVRQRQLFLGSLRLLETKSAASIANLATVLSWHTPQSFSQWNASKESATVSSRLARSLYWLGTVAVDHPETPAFLRATPLASAVMASAVPASAQSANSVSIPDENRFYVQPNAEIFAPPNLAPRTLFHLRRITGEKKGGAAGMHPLTSDSLRRGLDSGLTVDSIVTFLERFSQTGLPGTVKALVETTGRQHGRIQLIPAGYVLVTDDALLLKELNAVKTVAPFLRHPVSERVVTVDAAEVPELMKKLRQRGYAPLDSGEMVRSPSLPADPAIAPPTVPVKRERPVSFGASASGPEPLESGAVLTDPAEILKAVDRAIEDGLELEVEYRDRSQVITRLLLCPEHRTGRLVDAWVETADEVFEFDLDGFRSVRITGRRAPE